MPFVDLVMSWLKLFLLFGASSAGDEFNSDLLWITTLSMQLKSIVVGYCDKLMTYEDLGDFVEDVILLLVFEEPNIRIYPCVKGDINQCEVEVNFTFLTQINLDIGLASVSLILSKK